MQLPPPPDPWDPPIHPLVTTMYQSNGYSFGIQVYRVLPRYSRSIASVTVIGHRINGPVCDGNGNMIS